MAGYDSIKSALQNPQNFQTPEGQKFLEALFVAGDFAQIQTAFEAHFNYWNTVDPSLFNPARQFALRESATEIGAMRKLAQKQLVAKEEQAFKDWLNQELAQGADIMPFLKDIVSTDISKNRVAFPSTKVQTHCERLFRYAPPKSLEKMRTYVRTILIVHDIHEGVLDDDLSVIGTADSFESMKKAFVGAHDDYYTEVGNIKISKEDLLFDEDTYQDIRAAAANRFIHFKINQCNNLEALKAISDAKKPDELRKIFSKYSELALSRQEYSVLKQVTESHFNHIKAAALINQKLLKADGEALSEIAYSMSQDTLTEASSSKEFSKKDLSLIKDYYKEGRNQDVVKNKALAQLAKFSLSEMSKPEFDDFISKKLGSRLSSLAAPMFNPAHFFHEHLFAKDRKIPLLSEDTISQIEQYIEIERLIRTVDDPLLLLNNLANKEYREKNHVQGIPQKDLDAYAFRLAQRVFEDKGQKLEDLADAKDKRALEAICRHQGMTNLSWINEYNFKQLQNQGIQENLKAKIEKAFPDKNHEKLVEIIERLPLKQQKQVLEKPETFLSFLSQVTDEDDLREVLGPDNASIDVDALLAENEKNRLLNKIENSGLRAVIAANETFVLNEHGVEEINNWLRQLDKNYLFTKDVVEGKLGFHITVDDLKKIQAQFDYNAELYQFCHNDPEKFKRYESIYSYLLSLDKDKAIPEKSNARLDHLLRTIDLAQSVSEFKDKVQRWNTFQKKLLPKDFVENLSSADFHAFKEVVFKGRLIMKPNEALKESESGFFALQQERFKTLLALEKENSSKDWFGKGRSLHAELEKMAALEPKGIRLAFESASKEDFESNQTYLQQLEESCDLAIPEFEDQLALLRMHYQSVDESSIPKDKKKAYAEKLEHHIKLVEKELKLHQDAKKVLRGDASHPGAFQILSESQTHEQILHKDTFEGYKVKYGKYKNSERDEEMKTSPSAPVRKPPKRTMLSGAKDKNTLATQERKDGFSDVISVIQKGTQEEVAKFIAEPDSTKITTAKFPPKYLNTDPRTGDRRLNPAFIVSAFAAAEAHLLQRKAKGIKADEPIVIYGSSADEIEAQYFAMRTLLKKYPQNGLTENAIEFSIDALSAYEPPKIPGIGLFGINVYRDPKLASKVNKDPSTKRVVEEALASWKDTAADLAKAEKLSKGLVDKSTSMKVKETLVQMKGQTDASKDPGIKKTPALKPLDKEEKEEETKHHFGRGK